MKFESITVCFDMYGCPNRCKHCWLGHSPNGNCTVDDLKFVAEQFRPFTERLEVYDWYREPDYKDNYQELWNLCEELSDVPRDHFEVISVWRAVRDPKYVEWLSSLGIKSVQLTMFGDEEKTDFYTGRKGAYRDILQTIEILLQHRISPRIQIFVNKDTIKELLFLKKLIQQLELERRCKEFGGEFSCFLHQGSCDGENEQFYDIWITPEDLDKIPEFFADATLQHFQAESLTDVFGRTEAELCRELLTDNSTASYVSNRPVFYVDKDFNVYPNVETPSFMWRMGNLKDDGVKTVLENYLQSKSLAQHTGLTVPLCKLAETQGDPSSQRLFSRGDYVFYLLHKYCRSL